MTAVATNAARPIAIKSDQVSRDRVKRMVEKREAYRQDGIRAWNEYQTNGLYVTQKEADAWLAKLEDGQDVNPPKCHG